MEEASHSTTASQSKPTLVALPVEVLVYIVSFLSTREKVKIRCISKSLRIISEVPSLWEEFIWLRYAPCDEKILKHLLKTFGKHVRILHLADYIAPSKLEAMLKFCKNLTHLSVPSFHFYKKFEKMEKIVNGMPSLQKLDILCPLFTPDDIIQQILTISSNLKELSLHNEHMSWYFSECIQHWLEVWADLNYVPQKINFIFLSEKPRMLQQFITSLRSCLLMLRGKKLPKSADSTRTAWFNVCFKASEFSPAVPFAQLRVTNASRTFPSVKASMFGLLGFPLDILHLTEGYYHGNKVHKALLINSSDDHLDTSVTSLTNITYFDASYCRSLYPGHLEQLSIACPNLQRLDLRGNVECLSNLQGLHSLAQNCKYFQGLNLMETLPPVTDCGYDYLELWEVLCTMKLSQIAIEGWTIKNKCFDKSSQLIEIFKKHSSLQVLEVELEQYALTDNELLLLSYFPSIKSCRLSNLPSNNCYHTLKRIFSCKYLRSFFLFKSSHGILSLSLEGYSNLQQLYIHSKDTVPTELFIDTLCGHGGLEHVVLSVKSLTAKNIINIIENSSNLLTFLVTMHCRVFLKCNLKGLISSIKTKFSKRKLFTGGSFNIRQVSYHSGAIQVNNIGVLRSTDLISVWNLF